MRRALKLAAALTGALCLVGHAAACTINGQALTPQQRAFFDQLGLPHGDYYLKENGDLGIIGNDPMLNLIKMFEEMQRQAQGGAPAFGGQAGQSQQPYQSSPQNGGIEGMRVFWVYSPSIFSGATGGSSGYIHLCPGGVFYRSSEGSISVGGDYNSEYQMNDSWAGAAGTSRGAGRWMVQNGTVSMVDNNGNRTDVPMSTISQGSWKWGQTKYAVERGRASCP